MGSYEELEELEELGELGGASSIVYRPPSIARRPPTMSTHRPWPAPDRPWIMSQTWCDLLFAHWPVPVELLRPRIPADLTVDTFDGTAWIAVVPFVMRRTRPFRLPLPFGLGDLPELNVRTYVSDGRKPGVWFFSLDAGRTTVVWAARLWYHLPYFQARMRVTAEDDGFHYTSVRTHPRTSAAAFAATYRPIGEPYRAQPGSLDHWLTERYCLYTTDRRGRLYRAENDHAPWPLQPAAAEIRINTMIQALGIPLPATPPLLHFARRMDVVFWAPERL